MMSVPIYPYDRKRKIHDAATTTTSSSRHSEAETQIDRQLRRCSHQQEYGGDWSKIGADLLEYIQKKLLSLADILRCGAVCSSWSSITKTHLSSSLQSLDSPSSPPLIIWNGPLRYKVNWSFLDVLKSNGSNLYLPNHKSEQLISEMGSCVGGSSSNGGGYFLFLDTEEEKNLYLFHPRLFSGCAFRLPPIRVPNPRKDEGHAIEKAVLWGDPGRSRSYGIVVIHVGYRGLLFAKCGATQFTELDDNKRKKTWFVDIVCVKNRIYGITNNDLSGPYIQAWDCSSPIGIPGEEEEEEDVPRMVLDFKPEFSSRRSPSPRRKFYLVESLGDILMVAIDRPDSRRVDAKGGLTEYNKISPMCEVYKIDFKEKKWVPMNSLGNRALFITDFQSMSLSSHEFPQYQRNSIYHWHYVLSRLYQPCLGIFNMEDGSIKLIDAKKC